MQTVNYQYAELLKEILANGKVRNDRTGVGTISTFSPSKLVFDLQQGFPLLSLKKVSLKNIATELIWMLKGDTNTAYLHQHGCKIWDEWADADGNLGKIYGHQWRNLKGNDQIQSLIHNIKNDPFSRRLIVNAWNASDLKEMRLTPCHCFFQCYVDSGKLHLKLVQRSWDVFLGAPYNIASYALLMHILARETGLFVGRLIIEAGDAHIYKNHLPQVEELLSRCNSYTQFQPMPALVFNTENTQFDKYAPTDFSLVGYNPLPAIPAPVAI